MVPSMPNPTDHFPTVSDALGRDIHRAVKGNTPAPPSPIVEALERIQKAAAATEEMADTFERRLSFVLSPCPPAGSGAAGAVDRDPISPFEGLILSTSQRIEYALGRFESVLNRLQV